MFNRVKYFITKNIKQKYNYRDSLLKNIKTPKKKIINPQTKPTIIIRK